MVLILTFRPLATDGLNSTQSGALLSNLLTLFVGIMLIITADLEDAAKRAGEPFDSSERDIISLIIFIINMLVMAIPCLKFLSDGRVVDKVVTTISALSSQYSNNEEKKTIAAMIKIRNDQLKSIHNDSLAGGGAQSNVSGSKDAAPTTQQGALFRLVLPPAPAVLHGDFVFSHCEQDTERMWSW